MVRVGAKELSEVVLSVQDMNLMASFYQDVLGLPVKEPQGVKDFREFFTVTFYAGTCLLKLEVSGSEAPLEDESLSKLIFQVEDLTTARNTLQDSGYEVGAIYSPEPDVFACDSKDPEGNAFILESRSPIPTNPRVTTVIDGTVFSSPYVSINSRRGQSIMLLRNNKLIIAAEILLFLAFIAVFPLFGFADFICLYMVTAALNWLRGGSWSELGLAQPVRWKRTLPIGALFCVGYLLLQFLIVAPLSRHIFLDLPDIRSGTFLYHNVWLLLGGLLVAWTRSGFGEEMIFRGYLLNRVADLFDRRPWGWALALLVQSLGFALSHLYLGENAAVGAVVYGLCLGLLYLATRRNLWICAVAHGLNDSIIVGLAFLGL